MKKIIQNPYSNEVFSVYKDIELQIGYEILSEANAGNHWQSILNMTRRFGISEVDVFDEVKLNLFKKTGWIEYRVFKTSEINAFAIRHNNLQYLGFYFGLLYMIRDTFFALFSMPDFLPEIGDSSIEVTSNQNFRDNFLLNRSKSKYFELIPKSTQRQKCADLMTEIALNFVYSHEATHLVNCHSDYKKRKYGISEYFEFPISKMNFSQRFDTKSLELDADLGAMRFTLMFVNGFNLFNTAKEFAPYNIYLIWIYTIEVLFKVLNPFNNLIEIDSESHPNNCIRIINIFENSLAEAIELRLIKDFSEGKQLLDLSRALQNNLFNKVGFVPNIKGSLEENKENLLKYSQRCAELHLFELKEFIEKRKEVVKSDYEWLISQK